MCAPWRWIQPPMVCHPSPGYPDRSSLIASSTPWRLAGGAGVPAPAAQKGFWTSYPRRHRRHLQITTHQDDGSATGQRKDEADELPRGFPQQIDGEVRHIFDGAIDVTACVLKEIQMVEDFVEFDVVAVFPRAARAGEGRALGREIGHIVF